MIAPVNDYFLEMKDTGSFSLEDVLQEQPVILREQGRGTGKSASACLEKIGISEDKLHIAARINDQEAIKNLVTGGLGVSIVSEKAVHDYIDAKRLLQFELPGHIAGREFYIIYHKAVSYTHLDVYKRQAVSRPRPGFTIVPTARAIEIASAVVKR